MKSDARGVSRSSMTSRAQHLSRRPLLVSCLLALAISPPIHSAEFPGPYVAFGTYTGVQDGAGLVAANFVTGPLLTSSYNFSQVFSDPSGDSNTLIASIQNQNSINGVMSLFSQATATATLFSGQYSYAFGSGELEAGDTITVNSSTLANGTIVPFLFTFTLHYSATAGPGSFFPANRGGAAVSIGSDFHCAFGTGGSQAGLCVPLFSDIWLLSNGGTSSGTLTRQQTVNLAVGQTTYFVEDLWYQNYSLPPGGTPGTSTIDASNTAWLNITSLNPNATFTTGSGSTYTGSPEVPEPGTLALLAAGLIGLAGAKRAAGLLPIYCSRAALKERP